MSNNQELPTTHRGYTIESENDPWCIKHNDNFRIFKGEWTGEPGTFWYEDTIVNAMNSIDEKIAEKETPDPPSSPLSISGDVASLEIAQFAFRKFRDHMMKHGWDKATPDTFHTVIKWMHETDQAIKDLKFEEETKY